MLESSLEFVFKQSQIFAQMLHVHCPVQLRTWCLSKMTSLETHPEYKTTRPTVKFSYFLLFTINKFKLWFLWCQLTIFSSEIDLALSPQLFLFLAVQTAFFWTGWTIEEPQSRSARHNATIGFSFWNNPCGLADNAIYYMRNCLVVILKDVYIVQTK